MNQKLSEVMTTVASVDPITLAVVSNALTAAAREMRDTIQRSAFSPVIYEDRDFACGLLDSEGGTMAEAPGLTLFMGTLGPCVRRSLVEIGVETIQPGDVFCVSMPALTGSHIADFAFFMPIFFDGHLFGFAASKAHMSDVGAKDPYPTDSTDAFQEGLRLPPVRLYNAGVLNGEVRAIIMANSRAPETVWGDICAEIAGFRVGETACQRLLGKYGFDTITACVSELYERSERVARAAIRALPSGTWSAVDHMDSNGIEHEKLVKIEVSVTIDGDAGEITFDFRESAPQQIGPANAPLVALNSIARMMGKIMTSPETPANEGSFRPFNVIVGGDSIFNPGPTAPTNLYAKPLMTAVEAIVKAMAETIPERFPAGSGGDLCSVLRYGFREDGQMWYEANVEGVGQGASKFADGESALIHIAEACSRNLPVELEEAKDPVIVERYALIPDSGGAGEFRGGLGVRRDYRLQADTRVISMIERGKSPHWGMDGGKPGLRNYAFIESSIHGYREIMKTPDMPMASGDLISIRAGGGGGWGDPMLRNPQAVLRDVIEGYVTVEAALREYGVTVDLVSGTAVRG